MNVSRNKENMLKIGVIGCGAIGTEICKAIDTKLINARLSGIYDKSTQNCERLLRTLENKPELLSPDELIFRADMVVECASQSAVREFGPRVLDSGKDLMVLSVGALVEPELFERLIYAARTHNCRIYVPSGAIAGLDGLKSASIAPLDKVILSTTKNPQGLKDAPYVIENKIQLGSFHERTLLFEGSAEEATKGFPANVNVAASLSLAGMGAKETKVRVFVDPKASRNIHEITVEGAFGKFTCLIENIPSPNNPRTSFLAALSAIATLKKITEPLQIGT
ncbi:MAG TPA: aspartate dehydrogenase [Candidatus Methanoperedens sp.]